MTMGNKKYILSFYLRAEQNNLLGILLIFKIINVGGKKINK